MNSGTPHTSPSSPPSTRQSTIAAFLSISRSLLSRLSKMDSDNRAQPHTSTPIHHPTSPPKPVPISTDSDKEHTLPPLTRIPNSPSDLPHPTLSPPPPPPPQPQPTTEVSSSSSPPLSPGSAAEEAVQSGVGIQVPLEDRVKGPWSPEEDAILSRLVCKFGARNWSTIARGIPGRSGKSCRLRWCNQLDPYVKRKPFTGMMHPFLSFLVFASVYIVLLVLER